MRRGTRIVVAIVAMVFLGFVPAREAAAGLDRWSTNGPGAGYVSAISVSPSDSSTVYAGVTSGDWGFGSGIYKSTDGGRRWRLMPNGMDDRSVTEVAAASSDLVYAGTYRKALYKSLDGGAHWRRVNWPHTNRRSIMALAVLPSEPETIYASAEYSDEPYGAGLWKTTDGGASWTELSDAIDYDYVYALAIDPVQSDTVYAAGAGGVHKSTDGGTTWQVTNNGLAASFVSDLVIDSQHPSTLYAGGDDYYKPEAVGIYKSTDGGSNWHLLDMTAFQEYTTVLDLGVDPLSPMTVYASTDDSQYSDYDSHAGGVFKSIDGGRTWTAVHAGLFHRLVSRLAIDPTTPSTLYAGTPGGMF
jgi:photosystem II stability/assembly factor-like uncharacterized protein